MSARTRETSHHLETRSVGAREPASPPDEDPLGDQSSAVLGLAAAGDARAMDLLLKRARPVVYRWALERTGNGDAAEDVAQAVLLRVVQRLSTFRGESRLSSWLYRVTVNEARGLHRREARERSNDLAWHREMGREAADPREVEKEAGMRVEGVVRSVACTLPPLQLAAFRLVDLDGLKPRDAARALGRTQTALRSSLCRARRRIRDLLVEHRREMVAELLPGRWAGEQAAVSPSFQ